MTDQASPLPAEDLVSVVIPAFNAAATIDDTLRSVRVQTHSRLEILVIDDGSRDATADIVGRHASCDARIRLISQRNGGVARARNTGIEEAAGALVAPVDADDLWAPTKIAKQVRVLKSDPRVALVYTWFAVIDEESRIVDASYRPLDQGDVLPRICMGNLVGNGSTPLMKTAAVLEAGGYDASLRDRQAQGCEDLLLYFRIAERHHFGLVPEILAGYRQTHGNMSSDAAQMLRSWRIVADEMRSRHPHLYRELEGGEFFMLEWLLTRAFAAGRHDRAAKLLGQLLLRYPTDSLRMLMRRVGGREGRRSAEEKCSFLATVVWTDALHAGAPADAALASRADISGRPGVPARQSVG